HGVNAAIQSWGDRMNGVTILHNVLIADDKGVGVELRATDMGVNISNNIIDGLHDSNIAVGQLTVTGNLFTKPARQFLGVDGNSVNFDTRDRALSLFSNKS